MESTEGGADGAVVAVVVVDEEGEASSPVVGADVMLVGTGHFWSL